MGTQSEGLTARGRVPDLDRLVDAAGRQPPPTGLPGDRVDLVGVPERGEHQLSRDDLHDSRGEISTRRYESGTVGAPRQIVDPVDMSPQSNNLIAGTPSREGHRPVLMSGGEEVVVRAPRPHGNIARMGYFLAQPARVGVPDLDGAIPSPGSQARTVGAKSH